jgi:hypothetical protein
MIDAVLPRNIGSLEIRGQLHRQGPLVYPKHSAIFVRIVSAANNSHPAVNLAENGVSLAERGWQQRAISGAFMAPISSDSLP